MEKGLNIIQMVVNMKDNLSKMNELVLENIYGAIINSILDSF